MNLLKSPTILVGAHIFKRLDGTTFEIPCTETEYLALGLPNPVNPTHSDGIWSHSSLRYVIPLNSWVDEKGLRKLVNIDGEIFSLPNDAMVGDEITLEGLKKIDDYKTKGTKL